MYAGSATDICNDRRRRWQVTDQYLAGSLPLEGPVTDVEPGPFETLFVIAGDFPSRARGLTARSSGRVLYSNLLSG